jgi:hypothetical protein
MRPLFQAERVNPTFGDPGLYADVAQADRRAHLTAQRTGNTAREAGECTPLFHFISPRAIWVAAGRCGRSSLLHGGL